MISSQIQIVPSGGPFFDDLRVGLRIDTAPAVTLTDGLAAMHQAIVGDRLHLMLDATLCEAVTGTLGRVAHPALVWDIAIGQSTLLTRRVKANLFYRGLVLRRMPVLGDTLRTTSEVVALRQNRPRPDRPATGLAAVRVRTIDQAERPVLDFWRCAMLPLSDPNGRTTSADELDDIPAVLNRATLREAIAGWNLGPCTIAMGRYKDVTMTPGMTWEVEGGDVVSSAPELARLTMNIASAHHDATISGRRLVYGGHTIGIAASQLSRLFPSLVTIIAWRSCDHTGPVYEGDTLFSTVQLERLEPLESQVGAIVSLRSRVRARRADTAKAVDVLDWRLVAVLA
jgi:acyl dehydratase